MLGWQTWCQQVLFDAAPDIPGSAMTVKLQLGRQPYASIFAWLSQLFISPLLADLDIVWRHVTMSTGLF